MAALKKVDLIYVFSQFGEHYCKINIKIILRIGDVFIKLYTYLNKIFQKHPKLLPFGTSPAYETVILFD